ncbi:SEFIR domain-containing protein [Nitrosomonas sp.]|uniref:SEFIR domain-containing protein n=1 Tax=Nitrosomonas sp. TaxID=42353 RepID=UPI0025CF3DBB|nr:SEFIR domain-containing protein [Nitrosomonas sp.]MBV6447755.1 hypothetical protein [Nitrosomonas sp.]
MNPTARVFISYSHDTSEHRAFVLALANRLRDEGLDCQIDQYVPGFPPEGWQRWMETQIEQADFVLIVCTPLYLQRYRGNDPDGGRGVNFEGVVISQTLYDHYYRNTKFIPIIPVQGSLDDVPLPLKGYTTYTLPQDYTALYRLLTDQHATPAPEIGEKVALGGSPPPRFISSKENKRNLSDTMKAAYIGAIAAVAAAIIAGLLALFSPTSSISTRGDCSSVVTGDINSNLTLNCSKKD